MGKLKINLVVCFVVISQPPLPLEGENSTNHFTASINIEARENSTNHFTASINIEAGENSTNHFIVSITTGRGELHKPLHSLH